MAWIAMVTASAVRTEPCPTRPRAESRAGAGGSTPPQRASTRSSLVNELFQPSRVMPAISSVKGPVAAPAGSCRSRRGTRGATGAPWSPESLEVGVPELPATLHPGCGREADRERFGELRDGRSLLRQPGRDRTARRAPRASRRDLSSGWRGHRQSPRSAVVTSTCATSSADRPLPV
jgi:hypothetical protein